MERQQHKAHILLVDDSDDNLVIMESVIALFLPEAKVLKAKNGEQALQLVDSNDLRRELTEIILWGEGRKPLEEVLKDPRFQFLATGYKDGKRTENFAGIIEAASGGGNNRSATGG